MRVTVFLLLLVAAVIAINPAAAQVKVDPAFLIVPGKSIGAVRLGMTIDEVRQVLGQEQRNFVRQDGIRVAEFTGRKFVVYFRGDRDNAVAINVYDRAYRTAEGIGWGSTPEELSSAFGTPQLEKPMTVDFGGQKIPALYVEYSIGLSAHINMQIRRIYLIGIDEPRP